MGFKFLKHNTTEQDEGNPWYTSRHSRPLTDLSQMDIEIMKQRDMEQLIEHMIDLGYFRQDIISSDENGFTIRTEFILR